MKDKTKAILYGCLFIPLGFLYTYKTNKTLFWFSLVIYGLPLYMLLSLNLNSENMRIIIYSFLALHCLSVYRLFIMQPKEFYMEYPSRAYESFEV